MGLNPEGANKINVVKYLLKDSPSLVRNIKFCLNVSLYIILLYMVTFQQLNCKIYLISHEENNIISPTKKKVSSA